MTTVISLGPRGGNGGDGPAMVQFCKGWSESGGRNRVNIDYGNDINTGVDLLEAKLREVAGPKIVFGHSQGAQVASRWLEAHPNDSIPANELSFVLIGNPERKYGRVPWDVNGTGPSTTTRDTTKYTVLDVTRHDDGWANWPSPTNPHNPHANLFTWASAISGMFFVHPRYNTTDLDTLEADKLAKTVVGNTSYYVVP